MAKEEVYDAELRGLVYIVMFEEIHKDVTTLGLDWPAELIARIADTCCASRDRKETWTRIRNRVLTGDV